MPHSDHSLARLLAALEELGRREDAALAGEDAHAFLALQHSAEPLVQRVAELAANHPGLAPDLRARGLALIASREARQTRILKLLGSLRDEVSRLREARTRLQTFRAAISPGLVGRPPAFNATG